MPQSSRSLLIPVLMVISCFGAATRAAEQGASIVSVNGQVLSGQRTLSPGDSVGIGEKIETKINSGAKLITPDNSILDLGPSTIFQVQEVAKDAEGVTVTAKVDWGTIRSSVQKKYGSKKEKFFIRTKASVLAVRGTEFVVTIGQGAGGGFSEQVTVARGEVFVASAGGGGTGVSLGEGKQLFMSGQVQGERFLASSEPQVRTLNQGQVGDILTKNTVEDKTFTQVVTVAETDGGGDKREAGRSQTHQGSATLASISTTFTPPPSFKDGAPPPVKEPPRPDRIKGLEFDFNKELPADFMRRPAVNVRITFDPS